MPLKHEAIYRLQLRFDPSRSTYTAVCELLKHTPPEEEPFYKGERKLNDLPGIWIEEVERGPGDERPFDFINVFLDKLEGNYERLAELGIDRDAISVWYLYGYDSQCNVEFDHKEMKRLGENGISLCISCWDVHDYEADEIDQATNTENK